LNILGVVFCGALLRQLLSFLWSYRPVVDANIIDQTGSVGSEFHSLSGANIQTVI